MWQIHNHRKKEKMSIKENTLAAACYDNNTASELIDILTETSPDATDLDCWNLTKTEYLAQIGMALFQLVKEVRLDSLEVRITATTSLDVDLPTTDSLSSVVPHVIKDGPDVDVVWITESRLIHISMMPGYETLSILPASVKNRAKMYRDLDLGGTDQKFLLFGTHETDHNLSQALVGDKTAL